MNSNLTIPTSLPILPRKVDRASFIPDESYAQQIASLQHVVNKSRQPHDLLQHRMMTLGISDERHYPVQVYGITPPYSVIIDTASSLLMTHDPVHYAYLGGATCTTVSGGEIKLMMMVSSIQWLLPPKVLHHKSVHYAIPYMSLLVVMTNPADCPPVALYIDMARVEIDEFAYKPNVYTVYALGDTNRVNGQVYAIADMVI